MTPKSLHAAASAAAVAAEAARLMQSAQLDALDNAVAVLRAVAAFSDTLAEGGDANRATLDLAAAILGFEIDPAAPRAAYMLQAYTRAPR